MGATAPLTGSHTLSSHLGLRPITNMRVPCKICDGPANLYGVVDMNHPGQTAQAHRAPLTGVPIHDRRCTDCGFLLTDAFDDWSLYNDGYEAVDQDYRIKRPTDNAAALRPERDLAEASTVT